MADTMGWYQGSLWFQSPPRDFYEKLRLRTIMTELEIYSCRQKTVVNI